MPPTASESIWKNGVFLGSVFFGGVLGNIAAAIMWESGRYLVQPLLEKVPTLADLLARGGTGNNHDLLRALRKAECDAVVAVLDQTLLDDFGIRSTRAAALHYNA